MMSEHWPVKLLGEVCKLRNGRAYKKAELLDEGKYRVLRVGNFFTNKHWYYSDLELDETKFCETGDLLYAWSASFGPRIWEGERSIFHYHIWRVDYDEQILNKKYLYYWFLWDAEKIKSEQGTGTTMIHVSMKSMNAREISIPPLNEQHRIVSILDDAFNKIRFAQDSLSNNREEAANLIKSCVDEAFSGTVDSGDGKSPVVKLGELCDVITKGTTPTSVGYQFVESGINFVKIESITTNGEFLEKKFAKITSECHERLKRSQLKDGDILFSIAGALGRTAFVKESILPANTNQALAIIRLKKSDSVHPQYILKALSTGFALEQIEKNRAGAAQQNLSLTQMKAFEIPLPPIEVQKQISSKIDIILNNAISLQNSIEGKATGYIELKQSILQEAFSGKLTGGLAA